MPSSVVKSAKYVLFQENMALFQELGQKKFETSYEKPLRSPSKRTGLTDISGRIDLPG